MEDSSKIVLKFLGRFGLLLIISLFPELIGEESRNFLKGRLTNNYPLVIGSIGILALFLYTLWEERDKLFVQGKLSSTPQNVSQKSIKKIRIGLYKRYDNRITNKLLDRLPINLVLKYSMEGTTTKAPLYDNKTIRSSKIKEELLSLFKKHRGRLLIVGEPGTGKTTLLLRLALLMLEREAYQIPIIINMATWRPRFSSIEAWFSELLPQEGFTKGLVRQLIKENRLLPLFDGLDEIATENRRSCLEVIGKYGKNQNRRYVICSRIEEYIQSSDAPVYCQVMIKPLTLKHIKTGLMELNSPEVKGILDAIRKDKLLADAIRTPFYLNIVQLLFSSMKSWDELRFYENSVEKRKQEIVAKFVKETTNTFSNRYSDQANKWLAFLADRMNQNELVTFELVNLQYNWSDLSKGQIRSAKLLNGFVNHSVLGIFKLLAYVFSLAPLYGIIRWLTDDSKNNIDLINSIEHAFFYGIGLAVAGGSIYGLIKGLLGEIGEIKTKDRINWSRPELKGIIKPVLKFNLVFGVVIGIIGGLDREAGDLSIPVILSLVLWIFAFLGEEWGIGRYGNRVLNILSYPFRLFIRLLVNLGKGFGFGIMLTFLIFIFINLGRELALEPVRSIKNDLVKGVVEGFFLGILITIYVFLNQIIYFLPNQIENTQSYLQIKKPYQRFYGSIRLFYFSILQYFHIKYILCKKGLLPKRLVNFLDEATKNNILESEGGSWRFRHRILQDYFVDH